MGKLEKYKLYALYNGKCIGYATVTADSIQSVMKITNLTGFNFSETRDIADVLLDSSSLLLLPTSNQEKLIADRKDPIHQNGMLAVEEGRVLRILDLEGGLAEVAWYTPSVFRFEVESILMLLSLKQDTAAFAGFGEALSSISKEYQWYKECQNYLSYKEGKSVYDSDAFKNGPEVICGITNEEGAVLWVNAVEEYTDGLLDLSNASCLVGDVATYVDYAILGDNSAYQLFDDIYESYRTTHGHNLKCIVIDCTPIKASRLLARLELLEGNAEICLTPKCFGVLLNKSLLKGIANLLLGSVHLLLCETHEDKGYKDMDLWEGEDIEIYRVSDSSLMLTTINDDGDPIDKVIRFEDFEKETGHEASLLFTLSACDTDKSILSRYEEEANSYIARVLEELFIGG